MGRHRFLELIPETLSMIDRIPVVALASYEPPRIERVLSPEDLEREVHYAGGGGSFPPISPPLAPPT